VRPLPSGRSATALSGEDLPRGQIVSPPRGRGVVITLDLGIELGPV